MNQDRVNHLRREVVRHNALYYERDAPEITDTEYDALLDELRRLEREDSSLASPDSPTQTVGGRPSSRFAEVEHLQPMLSLANARNEDELRAWESRLRSRLEREDIAASDLEFVTEPKIDGLAISLIYRDGQLERGVTRGNGLIGEDVTANLRTIKQIPGQLAGGGAPPLLEVRGEVYIARSAFVALNDRRLEDGKPTYANPRNFAAGSIRQLDPKMAAARPLSIWIYSVGALEGITFESHSKALGWLRDSGFPVNEFSVHGDIDGVVQACHAWEGRRDQLDFEIDGAVVKVDALDVMRRAGVAGREPRGAIAWKFPPLERRTILESIEWNVGRTGHLVPLARLKPVGVGGVTVSSATLHNEEDLLAKDVRAGDEVIVTRAGDVIPRVVGPTASALARENRSPAPVPPTQCPDCGTATIKPEGSIWTICPNRSGCPGQRFQAFKHFVSRTAMDIDGLGEERIQQFIAAGWLRSLPDIYTELTDERLRTQPGFKVQAEEGKPDAVRNLLGGIAQSRQQPFERVLYAIGIPGIGAIHARALVARFGSIDALVSADAATIAQTPGIGPILADAIVSYLASEQVQQLVERLRTAGLQLTGARPAAVEGPLSGQTFVLTGTLPNLTRDEARAKIEAAGGKVTTTVSKKTTYVIAGADPGSKLDKALKLGVAVLDEAGLTALDG